MNDMPITKKLFIEYLENGLFYHGVTIEQVRLLLGFKTIKGTRRFLASMKSHFKEMDEEVDEPLENSFGETVPFGTVPEGDEDSPAETSDDENRGVLKLAPKRTGVKQFKRCSHFLVQSFLILSVRERYLYLHLMDESSGKQRILEVLGCSERTYKGIIARLRKMNYVYRVGGVYHTNEICVKIEHESKLQNKDFAQMYSCVNISQPDSSYRKFHLRQNPLYSHSIGKRKNHPAPSHIQRFTDDVLAIALVLTREERSELELILTTMYGTCFTDLNMDLQHLEPFTPLKENADDTVPDDYRIPLPPNFEDITAPYRPIKPHTSQEEQEESEQRQVYCIYNFDHICANSDEPEHSFLVFYELFKDGMKEPFYRVVENFSSLVTIGEVLGVPFGGETLEIGDQIRFLDALKARINSVCVNIAIHWDSFNTRYFSVDENSQTVPAAHKKAPKQITNILVQYRMRRTIGTDKKKLIDWIIHPEHEQQEIAKKEERKRKREEHERQFTQYKRCIYHPDTKTFSLIGDGVETSDIETIRQVSNHFGLNFDEFKFPIQFSYDLTTKLDPQRFKNIRHETEPYRNPWD